MTSTIPLTRDKVAIVDAADHGMLAKWKWYACEAYPGLFYAQRTTKTNGIRREILMHRLLMNAADGQIVDHVNGDSLDNRRSNLRLCDVPQNTWNTRKRRSDAKSRYFGVTQHSTTRRWQATIVVRGVYMFLGVWDSEEDAARAWDSAALHFRCEFAALNFPDEPPAPWMPRPSRRASPFRGAFRDGRGGWCTRLMVRGVNYSAYGFSTDEAAARAYDKLIVQHGGNRKRLNFPEVCDEI